MHKLSPEFLQKLIDSLDSENTVGITLSGSFARGEGGPHSDVDLWHYVRQEPPGEFDLPHLEYIDGVLVSVKTSLLEKDSAGLRNPQQAIWVIPALRQAQILLDKDGSVTILQQTARDLNWEALQLAADVFAARTLAATAEEVHKILDGLERSDESKITYALWSVTQNLSQAVLVQRGMLVPTENVYIDYAQQAAGRDSAWTHQFRLALGLDPLPAGPPAYTGFGVAGLRLYQETAALLENILQVEDARIVAQALEDITEAGY
jgi:predicted nucleotidyltransferase